MDDEKTKLTDIKAAAPAEKSKVASPILLSEDEKDKIRLQVEKELEASAKKKLADEYKASLMAAAKKKELFKNAPEGTTEDGLVPIFIDLPPVSECIRLDGVAYYPGRTYNVRPEVKEVILEVMGRGFQHEDSLNGKTAKENLYRKQNTSRIQQ